jgi:hypothetical protein
MTNPSAATPGPDHLATPHIVPGETVSSSSPKVTLGTAKSVAGSITTTVLAFLTAVLFANGDEVITANEWLSIGIATVIGAAAGFGIPYITPTKVTAN